MVGAFLPDRVYHGLFNYLHIGAVLAVMLWLGNLVITQTIMSVAGYFGHRSAALRTAVLTYGFLFMLIALMAHVGYAFSTATYIAAWINTILGIAVAGAIFGWIGSKM